ncbi:hypothetical protein KQX54_005957 [Cotesia glomerata]|uniref:Uncharacterized protein n=1 Tax=Cotesia glomerata TaxID=32391 RepID=A0AAV7I767_COTGL|nr:hypothetical protein KQX54_005957 [Cotesia glomerata]
MYGRTNRPGIGIVMEYQNLLEYTSRTSLVCRMRIVTHPPRYLDMPTNKKNFVYVALTTSLYYAPLAVLVSQE